VWGQDGGSAHVVTPDPVSPSYALVRSGRGDGTVGFTATHVTEGMGIAFRCEDELNCWTLTARVSFGTWQLTKITGGQVIDMQTVGQVPIADGTRVRLELRAAGFDVYVDDALARHVDSTELNDKPRSGLVLASGGDPARFVDALGRLQPVRGRLERATITMSGAPVYVDYAHTPDALAAAIEALRPHLDGRLIIVFGAGGDRDQGKRGPMGRVAAELADLAIVTDDNPRGEDPATIRAAVLAGAGANTREIADRREAIAAAIAEAGRDDIVLIAGKGHEQGQIVGAGDAMRVLPFDDVTVARECAAAEGA
jgi:UDP-N-acetylmuramate-alanine ligase